MEDKALAEELIKRLNDLAKDPLVAHVLVAAMENRVNVPEPVADHPTIQVLKQSDTVDVYYQVGFLGLLNGLVGVIPEGPKKDWGYIAATYSDEGDFEGFQLSVNPEVEPA